MDISEGKIVSGFRVLVRIAQEMHIRTEREARHRLWLIGFLYEWRDHFADALWIVATRSFLTASDVHAELAEYRRLIQPAADREFKKEGGHRGK